MLATEMFEHSGAGSEEYWHEVNLDLIDQPRGDVLPTDFGATHHSNVLVPGGRLRLLERALDAVRDEGIHAPFGDGVGRFVGDDEDPGRWVRAVRAPKPDRVIVGTAPGDDRSRAFHPAGEDLTVALVATEPHSCSFSPPSPSGCSGVAFEAFTDPSSDMLMSKITLLMPTSL